MRGLSRRHRRPTGGSKAEKDLTSPVPLCLVSFSVGRHWALLFSSLEFEIKLLGLGCQLPQNKGTDG